MDLVSLFEPQGLFHFVLSFLKPNDELMKIYDVVHLHLHVYIIIYIIILYPKYLKLVIYCNETDTISTESCN